MVRSLHSLGRLKRLYCTETRPYNQGARLTAYEAVAEGFPATLITDSMAALAMREKGITGEVTRLSFVPFLYQFYQMLLTFLFAHSCRRRSGQGCCKRRHGEQSGHVSAGHRRQTSRGTVLRGGAQHVLRPESGERTRHRD